MSKITGKTIRSLFDYQRFENDEKLGRVIDRALGSSSRSLSDDELELVAGGTEISPEEDDGIHGFCKKCNKLMPVREFMGGRYTCRKCGTRIDETTIEHSTSHVK